MVNHYCMVAIHRFTIFIWLYGPSYLQSKKGKLSISGTLGTFLDKLTSDYDGFTDEPIVPQCDLQFVENTFVDDSK